MKYYFIIIFFCFFRKLNEKCISHEKASIKQSYSAARCTALLKFFFLCCCAAIFFPLFVVSHCANNAKITSMHKT